MSPYAFQASTILFLDLILMRCWCIQLAFSATSGLCGRPRGRINMQNLCRGWTQYKMKIIINLMHIFDGIIGCTAIMWCNHTIRTVDMHVRSSYLNWFNNISVPFSSHYSVNHIDGLHNDEKIIPSEMRSCKCWCFILFSSHTEYENIKCHFLFDGIKSSVGRRKMEMSVKPNILVYFAAFNNTLNYSIIYKRWIDPSTPT